jgi:hypothetical protein
MFTTRDSCNYVECKSGLTKDSDFRISIDFEVDDNFEPSLKFQFADRGLDLFVAPAIAKQLYEQLGAALHQTSHP